MARMGRRHERLMTPSEILLRRRPWGIASWQDGAFLPVMARRRLLPSLRGGAAAEAIQAGRPASDGREVYSVASPNSGLLRARFARARNDGEQLSRGLAMTVTSRSQ